MGPIVDPGVHNAIRKATYLQDALRRIFGETSSWGLERVGETLDPSIDLWERPEWSWPRGEYLWSTFGTVGAVAGEQGFMGIRNPPGSNLVCVITDANVRSPGLAPADLSVSLVDSATSAATESTALRFIQRDTRAYRGSTVGTNGQTPALLRVNGTDPASVGSTMETIRAQTTDAYTTPQSLPYVLTPGYALLIQHNTVNLVVNCNFAGYAYNALPGELGT